MQGVQVLRHPLCVSSPCSVLEAHQSFFNVRVNVPCLTTAALSGFNSDPPVPAASLLLDHG